MNGPRPESTAHRWLVTLALVGGSLGFGYLSQPEAPLWPRWLALAGAQIALGLAAARVTPSHRGALLRLAQKTALWPLLAAGLAGAARLGGIDVYPNLQWIAILALAAAHALVEWSVRPSLPSLSAQGKERLAAWLLDVRWLLAIAGVPWSWGTVSTPRLVEFVAAGAAFLWIARPLSRPEHPHLDTRHDARRDEADVPGTARDRSGAARDRGTGTLEPERAEPAPAALSAAERSREASSSVPRSKLRPPHPGTAITRCKP